MEITRTNDDGKRIKAVERSFSVITTLREAGTVRIKDVADELNIPTSTAHVHLKTLESIGYVVRNQEGYRLALRFLQDGVTTRNRVAVYSIAKPEIDALGAKTGEVANLGVEENGQRVILYQVEGNEAVHDNAQIGEYTNMHWTALGKAMLAEQSEEYLQEYLDVYGLPDKTENTITDRGRLLEELEAITDRGFAMENEERREGIRSIAVPITVEGDVIGAMSITGPRERFSDQRIDNELLPTLKSAVNVVEVKYAYE